MALRNLLVHVEHSRGCAERVRWAMGLAASHGARLVGLYVVPEPQTPVLPDGVTPGEILRQEGEAIEAEARSAQAAYEALARDCGLEPVWRTARGDFDHGVTEAARYADLSIIGQHEPGDPRAVPSSLVAYVLMGTGLPVLMTPPRGLGPPVPERVLVAWNGSPQAARATHDALPVLARAERVDVLYVQPPHPRAPADTLERICKQLARHSVPAQPRCLPGHDDEAGEILLEQAQTLGAELLVMGGYGHSRLRELVLGGATREVLHRTTLPTLLAH